MKVKKLLKLILCSSVIMGLTACGGGEQGSNEKEEIPVATITMEDGKTIKVELDPVNAPITTENFVNLANEGFYDGLTFHRIVPGFVIQGGDPEGTGMGGSGKTIKGEFKANGVENNLKHTKGVISMARLGNDYDSATSQFFIVLEDSPMVSMSLDEQYAAFGKVVEGIEVVDEIAAVQTSGEKPIEDVIMKSVEISYKN